MTTDVTPGRLPTTRTSLFDPPRELDDLRSRCPVAPLRYADGHLGWVVTGYELSREVLSDDRFSSRPELRHSAVHEVLGDGSPPEDEVPGMFVGMDPPEHTRYRRLLTGELSVRRMRELEPRIAATARRLVEQMRNPDRTADLVPAFAEPLPTIVICDLLGIPYAEMERIRPVSDLMLRTDTTAEQVKDCYRVIFEFLAEMVDRHRREPADDLLCGLLAGGELSDAEATAVAFQLFVAGHETTANMLSLGTLALLTHPRQLAIVKADPGLLGSAVEELLRYLTVIQFGVSRGAREDVELGGVTIRAGQTVTVSLPAANRDPARFDRPDAFDVRRQAGGHLAFGFGAHQCVAQQLARAELRVGLHALLTTLPELRLAVAPADVPMRTTQIVYGVESLPVTW
jgi:cytochrome P450